MPKKKKNKKKWMRGVFGTFQNPSQYDGWNGDAGTISQSNDLFKGDTVHGKLKPWNEYVSIYQLFNHWISIGDQWQDQDYLNALPAKVKKAMIKYHNAYNDYMESKRTIIELNEQFLKLKKQNLEKSTQQPIQKQITQISTSGATPGYQTPFAFTGTSKPRSPKYLVKMGYKLVNEQFINSKFDNNQDKFKYYRKIILKAFNFDIKKFKQKVTGGLSDNISDITKYPLQQIIRGLKVQKQHTSDINIALQICIDHLQQDRDYYNKLKKIQNN